MLQTSAANPEHLDIDWLCERESAANGVSENRKDKLRGSAPRALCARHQKKNVLPARSIDDEGRELLCRFGLNFISLPELRLEGWFKALILTEQI